MLYPSRSFILLTSLLFLSGCQFIATDNAEKLLQSKIKFNLSGLDDTGLYGPYDGLRALSYEFCIPGKDVYLEDVIKADPSVVIYKHASGRIKCSAAEYLCIGSTHQENYREVLRDLAGKEYIRVIQESFFE